MHAQTAVVVAVSARQCQCGAGAPGACGMLPPMRLAAGSPLTGVCAAAVLCRCKPASLTSRNWTASGRSCTSGTSEQRVASDCFDAVPGSGGEERRARQEQDALRTPVHPPYLMAAHARPLVLQRREERRALEEKYDALYAPIYAKRSDVINGRQEAPENETGAVGCWGVLGAPARGLWLRQRGPFGPAWLAIPVAGGAREVDGCARGCAGPAPAY